MNRCRIVDDFGMIGIGLVTGAHNLKRRLRQIVTWIGGPLKRNATVTLRARPDRAQGE
jgi:hypothetical protein